ncbi:conserved protein, unknown function [Hepatocystis sp. ex Piliocolobus tephrosceles]|nr:conserved protein, unknown function [Hepatocystis sp. ex Piliocolobus tephrosceles]
MDGSSSFVGGKLKLKVKKKKIKKSKHGETVKDKTDKNYYEHAANRKKRKISESIKSESNIIKGTGRIVIVKNTVQGFETKFVEEVKIGDSIILKNPNTFQTEKKIVTSILTNKTLLVDSNFSSDISTQCKYYIDKSNINNENDHANDINHNLQYAKIINDKPEHDVVKVRQKTGLWSYKTVTKKIKGHLTNEEKLDERVKCSRDKFCW